MPFYVTWSYAHQLHILAALHGCHRAMVVRKHVRNNGAENLKQMVNKLAYFSKDFK